MSTLEQEKFDGVFIDTSTKEPLDKEGLLNLLQMHRVDTSSVKNSDVSIENVIPTLRKAKVKVPEAFFRDLASRLGFFFVDYFHVKKVYQEETRRQLITVLPYPVISKYKVIPLEVNGAVVDLAIDNPLDRRVMFTIKCLFRSWTINLRVVSSKAIDWAIDDIYSQIHNKAAMLDLYNRTPSQSAYKVLYPNQKIFILTVAIIIGVFAVLNGAVTAIFLLSAVSVAYFIVNPIKIYISIRGFRGARVPSTISKVNLLQVLDEDLPVYTILVPVFHEASILAQNLRNIYRLNYPRDKLDIKILMEEKDDETIHEAKLLGLFGSPKKMVEGIPREEYAEFLKVFDPIIVPTAKVTTKPRACNYGLLRAKGELCVIYDAEDNPDPDQLKKAVIIFQRSPKDVVCLQSKLNFYNADENLLTKWFSIEYASWYEFYLQGLDWIDAPIPLGGTSNHFRKKGLDELGRWDPYNVTEDADIGIRLARRKLKTEMIETYTYEEAPVSVKSWVVQRSRWFKGHVQTYLVHMRNPKQLFQDLGSAKFFKFQLTFGTSIFIPIINPILWILLGATLILPSTFGWLIPSYLQPLCLFNLIVGNLSYVAIYILACVKLKKYRYVPYGLLMPLYWVLLSVASWRGLIQLIKKPFYWDKTNHGVSKVNRTAKVTTATK